VLLVYAPSVIGQYYLRGEVRDEANQPVPGVKIYLYSKKDYPFYNGSSGGFGIPTGLTVDTVTLSAEGYETWRGAVETRKYARLQLKAIGAAASINHLRLSSFSKNLLENKPHYPVIMGESYSATVENEFVNSLRYPQTGFAVTVNRACYSNLRRFLNTKTKPPSDAVRLEEMLNYFNFNLGIAPSSTETFSALTTVTSCPWNTNNQLLFIALQARKINLDKTPPSNLVFLIDVSGSMDMPNRLPLLQSGFKLFVENLRQQDTVSIITYGGQVNVVLQPTSGDKKQQITEAIEALEPAGSTPGESAIRLAYKFAGNTFIKGGNNRIILATDGDFNVGENSEEELEKMIEHQRKSGIYLTCLGVGMGNYKDSKLEALAKKGNGNFAYLDDEREAEKVLVEEFAQTVYTVASNVSVTIDFNGEIVKNYRLIGFDNRQSAIEDSTGELAGGEVGSGHKLLCMFEIETGGSQTAGNGQVGKITLTYTKPNTKNPEQRQFIAINNFIPLTQADSSLRFATSVIMYGSLIKKSKYFKNYPWDEVYNLALSSASSGNKRQMEFLELIQKAKKIYANSRKRG